MRRRNGLAPWMKAAALGAVVGSRSLLMPALFSRTARQRRVARVCSALAALEMAADKTPWIPSRTSPLPLAGRMLIGAAVPFGVGMPVGEALAGASSAAASAFLLHALRMRVGRTKRGAGLVAALCEDMLALGAGRALTRRSG